MPKYWMISDRNVTADGLGSDHADLSFWVSDSEKIDVLPNWQRVRKAKQFRNMLAEAADQFPAILDPALNLDQRHVTLFVHGFNNGWQSAVRLYQSLCRGLFRGDQSMGICVLFTWPSDGMVTNYLPDRADARGAAPDLANVLSDLYDWMVAKEVEGAEDPANGCKAKVSLIAHSMGNYVLQKAMQRAWTRKNQPLLVSLINQLLMVAADVDNDLFGGGETIDQSDGDAIANLTYRITALYSGRDSVLGMSAGLKHFGKRRLGRSGIDRTEQVPDNVWDIDCSTLFAPDQEGIHSAYFGEQRVLDVMREVLRGVDRKVLLRDGVVPSP